MVVLSRTIKTTNMGIPNMKTTNQMKIILALAWIVDLLDIPHLWVEMVLTLVELKASGVDH